MTQRPNQGRRRDDRGAVLVIITLAMAAIVTMAAIVIDIGYLRNGAGVDQSVADLAVLAGSENLTLQAYTAACEDVVNYLNINLDISAINATNFCSGMDSTVCTDPDGATQAAPTTTQGKWTVSLHFPVPNSEIADPHFTGPGKADGTQCQRMRVIITSSEPGFFGKFSKDHYIATRSATVRAADVGELKVPALWLLDPTDCVSLAVSGGSKVTVGTPSDPGIITVDSDGSSCKGSQTTVSANGSGTKLVAYPPSGNPAGTIKLFAMSPGSTSCSGHACDPSDVAGGRLGPQPIGSGSRSTRAPIDWRFNCKGSYPTYHGITIDGCANTDPAYIDNLEAAVGTSGQPAGYQQWTSTYDCHASGNIVVTGNWWIDCPDLYVQNSTHVTFQGGNVVFDGGIKLQGGDLDINTANPTSQLSSSCRPPAVTTPCLDESSSGAAFAYMRKGDLEMTGGKLTANHVTFYQRDGTVKITGGSPPTWLAPIEGPLSRLSLWSEKSSSKFQVNGGAGVDLQGVFFTPEAKPFSLAGNGNWGQLDAQFLTYDMAVSGGGNITMSPNSDLIQEPPNSGRLIR